MEEEAYEEGIGDGYLEYAHRKIEEDFGCLIEEETTIDPRDDDPNEGDKNNEFDLLMNDSNMFYDSINNANKICCDEVAGCCEEYFGRDFEGFEVSAKGEKCDEVGEPPKRGKTNKVEYDYSLAMAGKNNYLLLICMILVILVMLFLIVMKFLRRYLIVVLFGRMIVQILLMYMKLKL